MGRVALCQACVEHIVNDPESPFRGLLPAGRSAATDLELADIQIRRLTERNQELEATGGLPSTLASAAVNAALNALEQRGYAVVSMDMQAPS